MYPVLRAFADSGRVGKNGADVADLRTFAVIGRFGIATAASLSEFRLSFSRLTSGVEVESPSRSDPSSEGWKNAWDLAA
jgi:hypothetical protein